MSSEQPMTQMPDGMFQGSDGTRKWYQHGKLHRDDGPAIVWSDGIEYWYQHGQWHREDGPAIERPDGARICCRHDKLHREDGPAVERPDGTCEYWLFGYRLKVKTLKGLQRKIPECQIRAIHES